MFFYTCTVFCSVSLSKLCLGEFLGRALSLGPLCIHCYTMFCRRSEDFQVGSFVVDQCKCGTAGGFQTK